MRLLLSLLLALSLCPLCVSSTQIPASPPAPVSFDSFLRASYYPAVYALYTQNSDGGYRMVCSSTAFESKPSKKGHNVRWLSASHCIDSVPPIARLMGVTDIEDSYFVGIDDNQDEKTYIRVKLVGKGVLSAGEDFSVFEADTKIDVATVSLGVDPADAVDEPLVNIADPMGLGTQIFRGRVTRMHFDRHDGPSGTDWYDDVLVSIPGVNGGSSGSSVICEKQRAICGIVVGHFGSEQATATTQIMVPISRFKKWYDALNSPKSMIPIFHMEDLRKMLGDPPDPSKKKKDPKKKDPSQPLKRKPQGR
jgi:hypothetical protein